MERRSQRWTSDPGPLRVVVLTSQEWGWETAAALRRAPGVEVVAVVSAPAYTRKSLRARLRGVYRREGLGFLVNVPLRRLRALLQRRRSPEQADPEIAAARTAIPHHHFASFHGPDCLETLRALRPDLGIVDGTGILKPSSFTIPRMGCVNLHCGKLPLYRGAPPVFWELYNGEPEVGVTIHWISEELDGGPIASQATFPIETAPARDPVAYAAEFHRQVLRPNGIRMLAELAARLAAGGRIPRRTARPEGQVYHWPARATIEELRRRVAERRLAS